MIFNAIRLCKFHFSMAIAKINPPIKRYIYLLPYEAVVSFRDKPPLIGKRTIGKSAVAAIGNASVIHQIATQTADAKTAFPSIDKPSALKNSRIIVNKVGPKINPIVFFERFNFLNFS